MPAYVRILVFVAAVSIVAPILHASALTPQDVKSAIDEIASNIEAHYLFPGKRTEIVAKLRQAQRAHRYDVTEQSELASRVSDDLFAASNDKHMSLTYDPGEFAAISAPETDDPAAARRAEEYEANRSRLRNAGTEELTILSGNVRYARITNFLWAGDESGREIEEAARFLRDGDAIIIDLRGNGGGTGAAVRQWISHFFDEPQLLISFFDGLSGQTRQKDVLPYLPGGRMTGKPLFVLIDNGTGSAAEEFAYHVEQFKLGTLVGETTAGAANNPAHLPIAPGFILRVSVGRPIHPVSNTNWEGVGVKPKVAVEAREALNTGYVLALEALAASPASDEMKARIEWAKVAANARAHPFAADSADLDRDAGVYEGSRTIARSAAELTYARPGRTAVPLTPLARDLFAFANDDKIRIQFERAGDRIVALKVLYADRPPTRAARTP